MYLRSDVDEWEVEAVTVVRGDDRGLALSNVLKPSSDHSGLAVSLVDQADLTSSATLKTVKSP